LAVAQTLLQSFYINRNSKVYQCEANNFRWVCYLYVGTILTSLRIRISGWTFWCFSWWKLPTCYRRGCAVLGCIWG
jgi:hypothetical protein